MCSARKSGRRTDFDSFRYPVPNKKLIKLLDDFMNELYYTFSQTIDFTYLSDNIIGPQHIAVIGHKSHPRIYNVFPGWPVWTFRTARITEVQWKALCSSDPINVLSNPILIAYIPVVIEYMNKYMTKREDDCILEQYITIDVRVVLVTKCSQHSVCPTHPSHCVLITCHALVLHQTSRSAQRLLWTYLNKSALFGDMLPL